MWGEWVIGVPACVVPIWCPRGVRHGVRDGGGRGDDRRLAEADHAAVRLIDERDVDDGDVGDTRHEIGRASCRERVEISVGAVSLKKKKTEEERAARSVEA